MHAACKMKKPQFGNLRWNMAFWAQTRRFCSAFTALKLPVGPLWLARWYSFCPVLLKNECRANGPVCGMVHLESANVQCGHWISNLQVFKCGCQVSLYLYRLISVWQANPAQAYCQSIVSSLCWKDNSNPRSRAKPDTENRPIQWDSQWHPDCLFLPPMGQAENTTRYRLRSYIAAVWLSFRVYLSPLLLRHHHHQHLQLILD